MTDRGAIAGCAAALVLGAAIAVVGCQHQQPPPVTPAPQVDAAPFTCPTLYSSVPDFDDVANEVESAAQTFDDADAMAALDAVAAKRGTDRVRCVVEFILPDLRNAPVTGVHLQVWEAR